MPVTIQNNGPGNSLVVYDVASDTTGFVVDADGNVGVGITPTAKLHLYTDSTSAYDLITRSPIVGLTTGNTVNMAYFADGRSAANDGLRMYSLRDSTGSSIGDWPTSSFHIQRNVDGASYQADIGFGSSILTFGTGNTTRMTIGSTGSVFFGTNITAGTNTGGLTIQGKDIELMTIMDAY